MMLCVAGLVVRAPQGACIRRALGSFSRVTTTMAALLWVAGCAQNVQPAADARFVSPVIEPAPEYRIQKGDELEVKFFYEPSLNERVTVRPDGHITLQLVDDVVALGLTPAELDDKLTAAYAQLLKQPEVSVIVRQSTGQAVYVGGEVVSPSLVRLRPQMTALEAVVLAGGLRETAEPASVILISRGEQNTRLARRVDLTRAWRGQADLAEIGLRPFDVVYVPKSFVAEANKFVDQYIRRMIPLNLSAGFSYTVFQNVDEPPAVDDRNR